MMQALLLSNFTNEKIEVNNLSKITQLVNGRAGIWTPMSVFRVHVLKWDTYCLSQVLQQAHPTSLTLFHSTYFYLNVLPKLFFFTQSPTPMIRCLATSRLSLIEGASILTSYLWDSWKHLCSSSQPLTGAGYIYGLCLGTKTQLPSHEDYIWEKYVIGQ